MNQTARTKLLMALIAKMNEVIDDEADESWGMDHVPGELAYLMAQAALHVVDVVVATETSMDEAGLLMVDENGVAVR